MQKQMIKVARVIDWFIPSDNEGEKLKRHIYKTVKQFWSIDDNTTDIRFQYGDSKGAKAKFVLVRLTNSNLEIKHYRKKPSSTTNPLYKSSHVHYTLLDTENLMRDVENSTI